MIRNFCFLASHAGLARPLKTNQRQPWLADKISEKKAGGLPDLSDKTCKFKTEVKLILSIDNNKLLSV